MSFSQWGVYLLATLALIGVLLFVCRIGERRGKRMFDGWLRKLEEEYGPLREKVSLDQLLAELGEEYPSN